MCGPVLAVSNVEPLSQERRLSGILHVISRILRERTFSGMLRMRTKCPLLSTSDSKAISLTGIL